MRIIQEWLDHLNMSQTELGRLVGDTTQSVNGNIKAKRNSDKVLKKYADALNISLNDFKRGPKGGNMDDVNKIDRITDIAFRLNSDALSRLYSYAVYLESQERSKKNISKIS